MNIKTAGKDLKKHPVLYEILWCAVALILSICTGVVLMYGAYKLPLGPIEKNARDSLSVFPEDHPSYDYWAPWYDAARLDLSTDATMLREAVYDSEMGALKSSMLNYMPYYVSKDHPKGTPAGPRNPSAVDLKEYLTPEEEQDPTLDEYAGMYGRYWHGYLVVLKPLLMKFTLPQIRMINSVVISLLMAWAVYEISRKGNWVALCGFLIALAIVNPISASLCLQYFNSCALMLVGTALTFRYELWKKKDSWKLFLFMGILSAFFDFLTYPLVTLCIPLLLSVFMTQTRTLTQTLKKVVNSCAVWAVGYGGMWAGKWLVGSLLSGQNLIGSALNQAAMRTNGGSQAAEQVSLLETLKLNWDVAFSTVMKLAILAIVVGTICWLLWKKIRPAKNSMFWLLGAVSLFPFIWYMVLNNHSWHNFWMTYRILSITACGGYLALFCFFQKGLLYRRKKTLQAMLEQTDDEIEFLQLADGPCHEASAEESSEHLQS